MANYYQQLVKDKGESEAKAYMASIRAKSKTSGLVNLSPEERSKIAKKGWITRAQNTDRLSGQKIQPLGKD